MKTSFVCLTSVLAALSLSLFAVGCGADAADSGGPATDDAELRAQKTLLCASGANESVYFGDESQILLEANVSRDGVLANAELKMVQKPNLGVRNETWNAQRTYNPSNPRYRGMQKYSSADAWCGYSTIAPKNLNAKTGTFSVYVQQACEGGFISTATLNCKVESRRPAGPDAPSGEATIELRFTSEGKSAAIDVGYYEANAFTGNNIVVNSTTTDIDLDNLVPDDGSESAPDKGVCFTGDVTKAKKILWAMLSNTDGNGDHWLDEGATITQRSSKLEVKYSVTGEGGSNPRELTVPACQ